MSPELWKAGDSDGGSLVLQASQAEVRSPAQEARGDPHAAGPHSVLAAEIYRHGDGHQ